MFKLSGICEAVKARHGLKKKKKKKIMQSFAMLYVIDISEIKKMTDHSNLHACKYLDNIQVILFMIVNQNYKHFFPGKPAGGVLRRIEGTVYIFTRKSCST